MRRGLSFRYLRRDWQERTAQFAKRCVRSFRRKLVLVTSTIVTPHGLEPICSTGIHAIVDIVTTRIRCLRNCHRLRFSGHGRSRFSACSEQVHTHTTPTKSVWGVIGNFTSFGKLYRSRVISSCRVDVQVPRRVPWRTNWSRFTPNQTTPQNWLTVCNP